MATKPKTKKYKLKTHKATAKRFRLTGSGKLMRSRGPKSHLRRRKSPRAKRELSRVHEVTDTSTVRRVKRLMPYIKKHKKPNPPGG